MTQLESCLTASGRENILLNILIYVYFLWRVCLRRRRKGAGGLRGRTAWAYFRSKGRVVLPEAHSSRGYRVSATPARLNGGPLAIHGPSGDVCLAA